MDFLTDQRLIFTSKENENIYIFFNTKYKIEIAEIFLLCATIGYKKNLRVQYSEYGREFRSNYIKPSGRSSLYSILLDSNENISVEDFQNKENHNRYVKILQEYAEGGMFDLIENVFSIKYSNGFLDENYDLYIYDILKYVRSIIS